MTTTQSTSGSMTLPTDEIEFLLNLADKGAGNGAPITDAEFSRLESLRGMFQDRDLPKPEQGTEVYLLVRIDTGDYEPVTVPLRVFGDKTLAEQTCVMLNEFASEVFEIQPLRLI